MDIKELRENLCIWSPKDESEHESGAHELENSQG